MKTVTLPEFRIDYHNKLYGVIWTRNGNDECLYLSSKKADAQRYLKQVARVALNNALVLLAL